MRTTTSTLALLCVLAVAPACEPVVCGEGTIERAGVCVAADVTTSPAKCGPFTHLEGDRCVVDPLGPTQCDQNTTTADTNTATGVTMCIGTGGGGGCGAPITCPNPATGKQTICGQLFDFETGEPFTAADATGTKCASPTSTGPCSLGIRAFDAIAFASNPGAATPLVVGDTHVDDCGRYRLSDITVPGGPFIGLGIDDASMSAQGPLGTTNIVGIATPKIVDTATKNFEAFVAPKATTDKWAASGGPPLSGGVYAMVFRARKTGLVNSTGVRVTRSGNEIPNNDSYFQCQWTRSDVMGGVDATGANGTALVTGASVADGLAYSGISPALPAQCRYSTHAGASLPNILFVQVLRPTDNGGPCPL